MLFVYIDSWYRRDTTCIHIPAKSHFLNVRYVDTTGIPNTLAETVLWTNPSPNSSFARQEIVIGNSQYYLDEFEAIEIAFKFNTSGGYYGAYSLHPGSDTICLYAPDPEYIVEQGHFGTNPHFRLVDMWYNHFIFSGVIGSSGLTEQSPSSYVIPTKISGYK